ncbi:family 20 glycosylhydrolase [Microbacterium sp. 18062]|uniref:family 20 glycosylhydrolase n=1 Tax=Microbacterium sp. 18062 TaxID=2681410 RepID=UPI0013587D59|nr:family 20 glycosylhydrolase [Microbacterium sp. 18062]
MQLGVVPLPCSLERRAGRLAVTPELAVRGDADGAAAVTDVVAARTGIRLPAAQKRASEDDGRATVSLRLAPGGAPESYRLVSGPDGVEIDAPDGAGLFYAAQTLGQLLTRDPDGAGWHVPSVEITDAPRFAHRGLMLDVARHFFPVEVVERLIDRAAALKLNVLHLHLSDDQGWRLALASRPELAARGSATSALGDPGGHYCADDFRRIVAHATARHMTVVPELDVPGHTHAVGLAHPELAADPVVTDEVLETVAAFGGGVPTRGEPYTGFAVGFSSLRIHEEATYDFLADVFGELAALTPGPYLHLGGDEALGTPPADFASFLTRATAIVADLGKIPIAWHEAGAVDALAPGTIGQYWGFVSPIDRTDDDARAFVARGGRLILSPADAIYLDMKVDAATPLGLTWASGPTSVERSYSWEPTEIVAGVAESDILGVEAALWTETIATEADIEAMVFPRIASAAEIAWSPASGPERTWEAFRLRLAALGSAWDDVGIRFTRAAGVPWAHR